MQTIPAFQTVAAQSYPEGSIVFGDRHGRIESTMASECEDYAAFLTTLGYTLRARREIPAGSAYPGRYNLSCTLTDADSNLYLFWDASRYAAFLTLTPKTPLPWVLPEDAAHGNVEFTQMQVGAGMSYVLRLPDDSFLLMDGGLPNAEDEAWLYDFLKSRSRQAKPVIAGWFFSHPDIDHIGLATDFLRDHGSEVDLRRVLYQFPSPDAMPAYCHGRDDIGANIRRFQETILRCCPNAVTHITHTGDVYPFPGVSVEILWSMDNTYPDVLLSCNHFTEAFRLTFDSGKTAVMLGDTVPVFAHRIGCTYGDYLKADAVQVAHHGLIGGDIDLYRAIDAPVCFWPVKEERFFGQKPERHHWCLGEGGCDYNAFLRDETVRKRTHYCHDRTVSIEL